MSEAIVNRALNVLNRDFSSIIKELSIRDYSNPFLHSHGVWKSQKKVSFNIASEASYVYILSGQKLFQNAKIQRFKCDILGDFQTLYCLHSLWKWLDTLPSFKTILIYIQSTVSLIKFLFRNKSWRRGPMKNRAFMWTAIVFLSPSLLLYLHFLTPSFFAGWTWKRGIEEQVLDD